MATYSLDLTVLDAALAVVRLPLANGSPPRWTQEAPLWQSPFFSITRTDEEVRTPPRVCLYCVSLSVCLSVCLSDCLSVCLAITASLSLSLTHAHLATHTRHTHTHARAHTTPGT